MTKPIVLIVYSGQGGEAEGYRRAGWQVLCTDINPQPRCASRFEFQKMSALEAIDRYGRWVQLIAGGPVCKAYSKTARIWDAGHPTQIPETRAAMQATGKAYVIENVEDARPELQSPIRLCGASFGLRTYRHRLFESNMQLWEPAHLDHIWPLAKMGRPVRDGEFYQAVGNFSGVEMVRQDMGVPWMNRDGINQCIPPAYSEFVGRQIIGQL